jgi:hypothetical protein
METKTKDMKLFHKLVRNKERKVQIQLQSSVLMVMTTKGRKMWSKHFRTTSAN